MSSSSNLTTKKLLLASSSKYRATLLSTLGLHFQQSSPNIDETAHKNENAKQLCKRLATQKAMALLDDFNQHIIISSDQCAQSSDGKIIGKPGTIKKAIGQLTQLSDSKVHFYTSLSVLSRIAPNSLVQSAINVSSFTYNNVEYFQQTAVEQCIVKFRQLSRQQIESYVAKENAIDCAGSFKSEGLGISLFEYIRSDDPNTLIGLPLITTCSMLKNIGIEVL